ncbi:MULTISPECIES: LysR family transcriptional regulator [unclassified Methylobacterium]|nr:MULTISPECIES: LysR family transcriptional regulator [unclassified Methylobacterium]PIU06125.1 MAG: LysR family transcriptional regulator [Methylobacterium sp. CG09_land_8_20_14_0_10_71_15]PIU11737.1 MAG: LysR family transcriptional regulator [Methylobacterium sp. CG08_land_8_20_14_0_20_71_15]GBU18790.1 transcriptional regulator [Methylobacterium sp.]
MLPLRLDSLDALAAIVRRGGFRAAAAERGVSSSALSQTITGLEQTLGIRLLHRTTRSVAPTEAGARLLERLNPALDDIRGALEDLDRLRDSPSGTLRINAPGPAVDHVLCPLTFDFMRAYPDVKVEIVSDAAITDIVAQGFDAGVRFGRQVAQNMIAVPLGPPLRYAIVASPDYVHRRGTPTTPHDLTRHDCIRRRFPGGTIAVWRFERAGEAIDITPPGRLTLSSAQQELQAALAGQGIAHVFDDYARAHVEGGALVEVLRDWSPNLPGWFLYYPSRRHHSAAMAAFLGHVRDHRD